MTACEVKPAEAMFCFDEEELFDYEKLQYSAQFKMMRAPGHRTRMKFASLMAKSGYSAHDAIRHILKLDTPFETQKVPDGIGEESWKQFWESGEGWRLIEKRAASMQKDPAIIAEMKANVSRAQVRIDSMSELASQTLADVMTDPGANPNARVSAAKEVLNRCGLTGGGQQKSSELAQLAKVVALAQRQPKDGEETEASEDQKEPSDDDAS